MGSSPAARRYRFAGHTLSPARRTLVRDGHELALMPRCFDLLVLLVERRNEAVSRHAILDAVWSDVVVTDGALSQAVRMLRRTLGDDPREPTFIRTVPRHGYRFVWNDVVEERDEEPPAPVRAAAADGPRWPAAAAGGAIAGAVAGSLGGLVLRFGPGSTAGDGVLLVLPLLGTAIGGVAAAGVGAGLAAADVAFPARRRLALPAAGAASGLAVGATAHLLGRLVLEGLFGRDLSPLTGAVEGLVLGGAVGLGYALATATAGGRTAAPQGRARVRVALVTGLACALAAGMLGWSGRFLGAMSLDFMAQSFPGSQVGLAPLARLLGEQEPGLVTRVAIGAFEGLMFGSGLAAGLTRRPTELAP